MKRGDIVVAWNDNKPGIALTVLIRKEGEKFVCLNTILSMNDFLGHRHFHECVFDNAELYVNSCTSKVKNPVEIMIHLIDQGYEVMDNGDWTPTVVGKNSFVTDMWQYCGKEKPKNWVWEPEWLE